MTYRLRVLPRFPANISGANGLTVERDGVNLVIKPDFGGLVQTPSVTDQANTLFMVWDKIQNFYTSMSFTDVLSIVSGGFLDKATYDPTNINASPFARANHTGAQAISTVTNLQTTLDGKLNLSGGTMTGAINMGSQKVTALATATANDEAVNKGQLDAYVPTGTVAQFMRSTAPTGWVKLNASTIGSASSGATRANADTEALFTLLWTELTDTTAPMLTSAGAGSTRGASAAADWAANKRLTLPDMRGEFPRALDDGRGVDSARALGSAQLDAMQGHFHTGDYELVGGSGMAAGANFAGSPNGSTGAPITDGTNGTPRTAAETRGRNVALLYCIKL